MAMRFAISRSTLRLACCTRGVWKVGEKAEISVVSRPAMLLGATQEVAVNPHCSSGLGYAGKSCRS